MQIRKTINAQAESKSNRQKPTGLEFYIDNASDENFSFIAGYTSGGIPFGLTHNENEEFRNENV